jgi:NAD+ diphosphatase
MRGGEASNCFSAELDAASALPDGYAPFDLRQLFDLLDAAEFAIAGRAKQIVAWDRDHQFCGRCATPMEAMEHERAKRCPNCALTNYPRISPAVIVAVTRRFDDGYRILLARNHRFPVGRYSVVAGFVEPGETLEECVRREVGEEIGIEVTNIRYFGSQPWPFPNSLMVGFTAEYGGGDIRLEEAEIADAQWFAPNTLPLLPPKISIARQLIDSFVAEQSK